MSNQNVELYTVTVTDEEGYTRLCFAYTDVVSAKTKLDELVQHGREWVYELSGPVSVGDDLLKHRPCALLYVWSKNDGMKFMKTSA